VLRDAGFAGWGAAATASSAALGAILFFRMAVRAGLALSIADLGHLQVTSGLADLAFALTVISCFPAAMFVMSGAFGLSRAGIISKRFFSAGVAAVVLVLLGGTTWASSVVGYRGSPGRARYGGQRSVGSANLSLLCRDARCHCW
jgi:hypothetical protein